MHRYKDVGKQIYPGISAYSISFYATTSIRLRVQRSKLHVPIADTQTITVTNSQRSKERVTRQTKREA